MAIEGIDVSHWQGDVDWKAVKKSGRQFAFAKATEGRSLVDEKFEQNWKRMKDAGLIRGAYHFAKPTAAAKPQARHFHKTVKPEPGDLPLVLDLEDGEQIGSKRLEAWVRDFVAEIESLSGKPPIIYSGGFWKSHLNHVTENLGCLLWLPQYGPKAESPRAWKTWTFWQYSDGTINAARLKPVPGVGQSCDRNRFRGSVVQLRKFTFGNDAVPSDKGKKTTAKRRRSDSKKAPDDVDLSLRDIQEILKKLGWPLKLDGEMGRETFGAIKDFQRGFAWWDLLIDGNAGIKTREALRHAADNDGSCSLHFKFAEFKSKGNGWIKVHRSLIRGLEEVRDKVGPLAILSGYRDPAHNTKVGGAPSSQHLHGNACDPVKDLPLDVVKGVRRFSGIGIRKSDNKVRHVDVRHEGPNTTGGTTQNPTIWFYA
jgi:GH25 family lysozyme M1 (1,4-beta-N-acetylmuramidase)